MVFMVWRLTERSCLSFVAFFNATLQTVVMEEHQRNEVFGLNNSLVARKTVKGICNHHHVVFIFRR
jgi:hypothetical protein